MKKALILIGCSLIFSACNRSPEPKPVQEHATTNTQKTVQTKCQILTTEFGKINHDSTVEQLDQINTQLKHCLPLVEQTQRIKWLTESTQMYARFLATPKNTEQENNAFEAYGYSILDQEVSSTTLSDIKGNPELFKKLSTRDQYLIKHQGKSYIDFQYVGEGIFQYRRQPQYLADVFAPYLPEDQRQFIQRMAQDNQNIFYNDASISIAWADMAERALFWEKYIQQYPKGYFIQDAKDLFNEYSYLLFMGIDNTPVSDEFAPNTWIDEQALATITQLTKTKDTALAQQATLFLKFINTPIAERNTQFDLNPLDDRGEPKTQAQLTHEQLKQFLKIKSPWEDQEIYKDCHTDSICLIQE